jgi:hypothetical protein
MFGWDVFLLLNDVYGTVVFKHLVLLAISSTGQQAQTEQGGARSAREEKGESSRKERQSKSQGGESRSQEKASWQDEKTKAEKN